MRSNKLELVRAVGEENVRLEDAVNADIRRGGWGVIERTIGIAQSPRESLLDVHDDVVSAKDDANTRAENNPPSYTISGDTESGVDIGSEFLVRPVTLRSIRKDVKIVASYEIDQPS